MRTWLIPFWTFVAARNGDSVPIGPIALGFLFSVLSFPASILGNEAAIRYGRHRAITTVMIVSTCIGLAIGANATAAPLLLLGLIVLYGITIPADSGALTSGMSASAVPAQRGATMALHTTVGFGLSAAGAWAVGVALDAGGGAASPTGWLTAFAVLAVGSLLGPVALWWSRKSTPSVD
jgi:hypothetical protein